MTSKTLRLAVKQIKQAIPQRIKPNAWHPKWKTDLLNLKLSNILPRG
jgi:hypothetical protein